MRVLTLGCFDTFHTGHVNLLRHCREMAGRGSVTVGLNTDDFTTRYKGRPPVITYSDRKAVLESCRYVDAVVANDQSNGSARDVIAAANPDVIVVGSDWRDRDYLAQIGVEQEWLDDRGIGVTFVPYTTHISSSQIRARL